MQNYVDTWKYTSVTFVFYSHACEVIYSCEVMQNVLSDVVVSISYFPMLCCVGIVYGQAVLSFY